MNAHLFRTRWNWATALVIFTFCVSEIFAANTDFYVQTTASNLNAGSSTADAAAFTYTSVILADGWNASTGVFTVASGTPNSDMPTMNDGTHYASVYVTAGATVATFVGRITGVSSTTITVSLTAVAGTPPATDALGATTLKVDGAWDGPSGAIAFPFNFVTSALNSGVSGSYPRVNFKNNVAGTPTDYTVTAAMTHTLPGPIVFQGYTTTVADGGRAVLANITTTASYTFFSGSGANCSYADLIFDGDIFTSGTNILVNFSGAELFLYRLVFRNARAVGTQFNGAAGTMVECEAFNCNKSNTAATGAISIGSGNIAIRTISHDNAGSNSSGFAVTQARLFNCIADTNGAKGFLITSTLESALINCDAYNNGGDGADLTAASAATVYIENCNFINNGTGGTGYGINSSGSVIRNGAIVNCGFGAGTEENATGTIAAAAGALMEIGTVTYPPNVTPYNAPSTGDFDIVLAAAKAAGRGAFTQTQASYTGTLGVPTIGASQPSGAGGGQRGYSR